MKVTFQCHVTHFSAMWTGWDPKWARRKHADVNVTLDCHTVMPIGKLFFLPLTCGQDWPNIFIFIFFFSISQMYIKHMREFYHTGQFQCGFDISRGLVKTIIFQEKNWNLEPSSFWALNYFSVIKLSWVKRKRHSSKKLYLSLRALR